jgi:hypothetical protein
MVSLFLLWKNKKMSLFLIYAFETLDLPCTPGRHKRFFGVDCRVGGVEEACKVAKEIVHDHTSREHARRQVHFRQL